MNARERKYSRHKFGEDAPACATLATKSREKSDAPHLYTPWDKATESTATHHISVPTDSRASFFIH